MMIIAITTLLLALPGAVLATIQVIEYIRRQ